LGNVGVDLFLGRDIDPVLFEFNFLIGETMLNQFLADFAQFVEDVLALLGCGWGVAVPGDIFGFSQAIEDISQYSAVCTLA
jgi:hypothetical protein